jgi:hypothetical protein
MPTPEIAKAREDANLAASAADAEWDKLRESNDIRQLDAWLAARRERDTAQDRFETMLRAHLEHRRQ